MSRYIHQARPKPTPDKHTGNPILMPRLVAPQEKGAGNTRTPTPTPGYSSERDRGRNRQRGETSHPRFVRFGRVAQQQAERRRRRQKGKKGGGSKQISSSFSPFLPARRRATVSQRSAAVIGVPVVRARTSIGYLLEARVLMWDNYTSQFLNYPVCIWVSQYQAELSRNIGTLFRCQTHLWLYHSKVCTVYPESEEYVHCWGFAQDVDTIITKQ